MDGLQTTVAGARMSTEPVRELRASSAYGRHYIWGAVWPHGREHAKALADDRKQVQILERELAAQAANEQENAA